MIEPIVIVLLIGATGGIVRALLGYQEQAEENENFDYGKMGRSMVRAAIVGAFVVYGSTSITGTEINMGTYIMAFFLSVGADVLTKEGAGVAKRKLS